MLAAPIGEAVRIRSTNVKFSQIFFPIGGVPVRIVAPIVLAQHKENERIGEARLAIRSALTIVTEIA
jgi:hypothetical protein